MIRYCILLVLAWALSACAIVEVRTPDAKDVQLSVWPLGVKVSPAADQATSVATRTIGLTMGCGAVALGASALDCTIIDPKTCGVAVIRPNGTTDEDALGKIADRTKAACLGKEVHP